MSDVGYTVLTAANSAEALQLIAHQNVDCVVTDVKMLDIHGDDLCSKIRAMPQGERIQVLFLTGREELELIERAYSTGANDFTFKPLNFTLFLQRLRYSLRNQDIQDALRQSEQRLHYAQRLAQLGHWERTLDGQTRAISPSVCQMLGSQDPLQLNWDFLCKHTHRDDVLLLQSTMQHAIAEHSSFQLEHRYHCDSGAMRILLHQGEFKQDSSGELLIYSTVQDVTAYREKEEQVRFLASHDQLTGLPNRASVTQDLARIIANAEKQQMIAVFALRIDDFSRFTSSLGQDASNVVLLSVGKCLRAQLRDSDHIAVGKDAEPVESLLIGHAEANRFICVVNNFRMSNTATSIARRLQRAIAAPIKVGDTELLLTASIGISLWPDDSVAAEQLIDNAFAALTHTRGQKGACQFFSAEISQRARQQLSLEAELRQALNYQEFELFFQPRLNLADNCIHGAEALARWRHPTRGIVGPSEFIPLLEKMDLIAPMGNLVIELAARQAARWQQCIDANFRISFNISPLQFGVVDLATEIDQAIARARTNATNLEIEVTESALIANPKLVIETLAALRERGLRVALDDFGTGFSSLSLLRDLPLDILKIDRSFVNDIGVTRSGSAMVTAILVMARALGLECVGEGVEKDTQLNFLTHHHCSEAQGFLLARPMPAIDCENWINNWHSKRNQAACG
jgi:diguanylate cyclase (GGDEF)-like protein